jgi:hypothetical protein
VDHPEAAGSIKFFDGQTVLNTTVVSGGKASFTTSILKGGTHKLSAKFVPADALLFTESTSSESSLVVNPPPAVKTVTSLAIALAGAVTEGAEVTLTATLDQSAATGTVKFLDGTDEAGTATVAGGKASLKTTKLTIGTHILTAQFVPADAGAFIGSTSEPLTLEVKQAPEVTGVTVGGKDVQAGSDIAPGSKISVAAKGFMGGETVTGEVHSTVTGVGTAAADANGNLTATVTIPTTLEAGSHTLVLKGRIGSASFAFTVVAAAGDTGGSGGGSGSSGTSGGSGGLAQTGADSALPAGVGLAMVFGGAAAVFFTRRGRDKSAARG